MSVYRRTLHLALLLTLLAPIDRALAGAEAETDPPEIAIGERLFLETRFAQGHAARPGAPDPVMATTTTTATDLPGPFAGSNMNCRACHLVDEHHKTAGGGMRSYADFARRPPIPSRADGLTVAARNSQPLVGAANTAEAALLLHFDGEFATMTDLVKATLTGRNFGWVAGEEAQAVAHIAQVIRSDDGSGELAREFGGPYRDVLRGTDAGIPAELRLPTDYRIDVATASDEAILEAVARLIAAYVDDLDFSRDADGAFDGSPYDRFLEKNGLPRQPRAEESPAAYSQRLLQAIEALDAPRFVTPADGSFETHAQTFAFGAQELAGLKLFFRPGGQTAGGNCTACHAAPLFTDHGFHNTGITQTEYDAVHGSGAFTALEVPALNTRNGDPEAYLPPSRTYPNASERFRAVPTKDKPGYTDLGLWNIFANPDLPAPQAKLRRVLCAETAAPSDCSDDALLAHTVARFKTPSLRDLGHSEPYMHNGKLDDLEAVVAHYISAAQLARGGALRNAPREFNEVQLDASAITPLVAFLKALNEDYD